jgi:hypothetical protein
MLSKALALAALESRMSHAIFFATSELLSAVLATKLIVLTIESAKCRSGELATG